MKFENFYYLALGVFSVFKSSCGKSMNTATDKAVLIEFENFLNCTQSRSSDECLQSTGRKRKGDGGGGGNNVVVVSGGGGAPVTHDHTFGFVGFDVDDDDDDHGGKKGRKGKKRKKNKGGKKIYKHVRPIMFGVGGLKLILDHFLLKKLAFFSFFSFILSKISFILASLVALKQFFHNSGGHSRAESNKLEVIHIPIKKFVKKSPHDVDWDESKIIPITYSSASLNFESPSTSSPYFTYPSQESFLSSSEEELSDEFVPKVNGAGEYNFDTSGNAFDKRADKIEVNHVHSPFV